MRRKFELDRLKSGGFARGRILNCKNEQSVYVSVPVVLFGSVGDVVGSSVTTTLVAAGAAAVVGAGGWGVVVVVVWLPKRVVRVAMFGSVGDVVASSVTTTAPCPPTTTPTERVVCVDGAGGWDVVVVGG